MSMVFGRFFDGASRRQQAAVDMLYVEIVALARDPWLYRDGAVPDTFDGRFEMMVWHLAFVVRRLRDGDADARDFSQALFDAFLDDMDKSMREAAVGDIAVPKRLKKMVRVWFGRIRALEEAGAPSAEAIEPILARNLYPETGSPPALGPLASLLAGRWQACEAASPADLLAGRSPFAMEASAA